MVQIYALCDPETKSVRYVGQTMVSLRKRLQNHCHCKAKCHLTSWIASLAAKGLKPEIVEICQVSNDEADDAEKLHIRCYRQSGADLVNHDDGGRNSSRAFSEYTRAKMSAARKGRPPWNKGIQTGPQSPELIARRAAAVVGTKHPPRSPESRAKMSAAHKGKKMSPETVERMRLAQRGEKNGNFGKTSWRKGKTFAPMGVAIRAKISASKKGKPCPKSSAAKLGRPWSAARREAFERRKRVAIASDSGLAVD